MASDDLVELRGDVPRVYASTLDAEAFARGNGANRMTILREILCEWHRRKLHAATLIVAVNRAKGKQRGTLGDAEGNLLESGE